MITRGTTPTLSFKINSDIDLNTLAEVWITFHTKAGMQPREKTYTLDDVTVDPAEKTITLVLSQEDTLYFDVPAIQIQIRLKTTNDLAYASGIIETSIGKILKDGVI